MRPGSRSARIAMVYVVIAGLLWATIEGMGGLLDDGQSPLQVVWVRYAAHLVVLLAIFAPRRGSSVTTTSQPRLQVVRGLLMLGMPLAFLSSLAFAEPENVLAVFWITPLLTMLLSAWLLRERVEHWQWLAAAAGLAGTLLLLRPDAGLIGWSTIPAVIMALCMSLYLVLTRMLRTESTVTNLFYTAACVFLPLSVVAPLFWKVPGLTTLGLMIGIGILGLLLLYGFDRATDLAPVSVTAPMLYTQVLWMTGLSILAGSSHVGKANTLGGFIVAVVALSLFAFAGRGAPSGATGHTPAHEYTSPVQPGVQT